ncbi:small ubiquitin-related modifier 1-like [Panicum virgatum]|jgi:small ubiquitin-related modifier|uniref:Rad60/SUMO-like domain-containing protein n=1 Tax=Panicum virgatum TaxID=38727 RepID=A0A8T0RIC7_PANVG|nr:small ubiquitin-related modifier 1-like [Panicum virgatum]KAG2585882.1 hypothetical protein PVAP13_5NG014700 [Panicum virgatum]
MSPPGEEGRRQGSVKTEPEDDPLMTLKVLDQEGRRAFHTMRMSDKVQGVMNAYYKKAAGDVTYGTGTFMFDGSVRLRGCNTPAELDLDDGDEIEFFPVQVGGGWLGDGE